MYASAHRFSVQKEQAEFSMLLSEGYERNKLLNFTGKDGNHMLKK